MTDERKRQLVGVALVVSPIILSALITGGPAVAATIMLLIAGVISIIVGIRILMES